MLHHLLDTVLSITAPELRQAGQAAINKIRDKGKHDHVAAWTSSYSAMSVIVNRETIRHRDSGGAPTHFDALVAAGTASGAYFEIPDIGMRLKYEPGTVVVLAGRLLSHRVLAWKKGERICLAHYMRDNVHERYQIRRPGWPIFSSYEDMMSVGYKKRQQADSVTQKEEISQRKRKRGE